MMNHYYKILYAIMLSAVLFSIDGCNEPDPEPGNPEYDIENVEVSPNPAFEYINIGFVLNEQQLTSLKIINLTGTNIHTILSEANLETSKHQYDVDIKDDKPGVYLGKITNPSDTVVFKYIKK